MTKIFTLALSILALNTFAASSIPLNNPKELVKMELWIFGINEVKEQEPQKTLPEELSIAIRKLDK